MMEIRAMKAADAPLVAAFLGQSWRQTYTPILGAEKAVAISRFYHAPERLAAEPDDPAKRALVALRADGSVAACALVEIGDPNGAWLERLHVDRKDHGNGLAATVIEAVFAAAAGRPHLDVEVIEGNDRALAFYRKHGFVEIGHGAASHGVDGHRSFILRREL